MSSVRMRLSGVWSMIFLVYSSSTFCTAFCAVAGGAAPRCCRADNPPVPSATATAATALTAPTARRMTCLDMNPSRKRLRGSFHGSQRARRYSGGREGTDAGPLRPGVKLTHGPNRRRRHRRLRDLTAGFTSGRCPRVGSSLTAEAPIDRLDRTVDDGRDWIDRVHNRVVHRVVVRLLLRRLDRLRHLLGDVDDDR